MPIIGFGGAMLDADRVRAHEDLSGKSRKYLMMAD
jgi:hypothetical protein